MGVNQIRAGAVRSSELHDGSVTLLDISKHARSTLRGATGPAGAIGPPGPSATRYFAAVNAAGAFVRGNATSGGRAGSTGTYAVGFGGPVSACAVTASLGSTDASVVPPGHITTSDEGGRVGIHTYDSAGAPTDLPFQLIVAC
ncbi:MAG: hypothetical protein JWM93_264 [Frankiales bacterium]|nr:hypothetical protein [Frankiales bacterium]